MPFIAALVAIGPLAMDIYLPAIPTMRDFFGASIEAVNSSIALFILGYGVGQFFGGPISDQVGRKLVGITGLIIFVLCTFAILLTQTIEQLQVVRILQAIGGGLSTAICMGAIRDAYAPKEAGMKFPIVMMIMMLAPLFSPALGTALLTIHWKAIFVFLAFYSLAITIIYMFRIPETNPQERSNFSLPRILKQYFEVITHRYEGKLIASRYVAVMALASSSMMVFITVASFVYMDYFGVSEMAFPLFFGANVIGMIAANMTSMKLMKTVAPYRVMSVGLVLQVSLTACLLLTVIFTEPGLWLVTPLIVLTVSTGGLINPNGMAIYMSFFPKQGGSASATFTTLMFALGGMLGALATALHDDTLLPVFAVMFSAALLALVGFQFLPNIDIEGAANPGLD